MKNKPLKHNGKTVWCFSYLWTDDLEYNKGYKELHGRTIGTKKTFEEMRIDYENDRGFECWEIKKRHATQNEYNDFIHWL